MPNNLSKGIECPENLLAQVNELLQGFNYFSVLSFTLEVNFMVLT